MEVLLDIISLQKFFDFCTSFKKITTGLGFELDLRTSNRKRDILYATLGDDDVYVTINNISLFIPQITPSPETQVYFNQAISESFTLSNEFWITDRKPVDTAEECHIDISSASNIVSPLHLIAPHQLTQRPDSTDPTKNLSNNRFNTALFDHAKVGKKYVEIDGVRYPKSPILINYDANKYLDQNRDLKLYYKEDVGEHMLAPIISYDEMKNNNPFQIFDFRFQVDHISPKKFKLFQEYHDNPVITIIYKNLIKHREIKMISDGGKIIGIEVV